MYSIDPVVSAVAVGEADVQEVRIIAIIKKSIMSLRATLAPALRARRSAGEQSNLPVNEGIASPTARNDMNRFFMESQSVG